MITFERCRLIPPKRAALEGTITGNMGDTVIKDASLMASEDYARLVRLAFPWWRFWLRRERRRFEFSLPMDELR